MQGSNDTNVSITLWVGYLTTMVVTILNVYVRVDPPITPELAAAGTGFAVVSLTALVQRFAPADWLNRKP
jgi:hypothetical protein